MKEERPRTDSAVNTERSDKRRQGEEKGGQGPDRDNGNGESPYSSSRWLNRVIERGKSVLQWGLQGDGSSPLNDVRSAFGHLNARRIVTIIVGLALFVFIASGVYTVQPGEVAVVQRFGRVVAASVPAGLHFRLPWPIDIETVVNTSQVRRESVGAIEEEGEHPLHIEGPGKLQVLSGDTNIIDYEVIVQYQVEDPVAYLFNVNYPAYQLVRDGVRAAVTSRSGTTGVENILTAERQRLQNDVRTEVQSVLDGYNSGLRIISTSFQKAYPPEDVADSFRDVSSAREDRDRSVNNAEGYRNSVIPESRGEGQKILSQATSQARAEIDRATGAAQSFNSVLSQYRTNSKIYGEDVTRFRLYLETMEKILPAVQTYIVAPSEDINLRIMNGTALTTFPPGFAGGQ